MARNDVVIVLKGQDAGAAAMWRSLAQQMKNTGQVQQQIQNQTGKTAKTATKEYDTLGQTLTKVGAKFLALATGAMSFHQVVRLVRAEYQQLRGVQQSTLDTTLRVNMAVEKFRLFLPRNSGVTVDDFRRDVETAPTPHKAEYAEAQVAGLSASRAPVPTRMAAGRITAEFMPEIFAGGDQANSNAIAEGLLEIAELLKGGRLEEINENTLRAAASYLRIGTSEARTTDISTFTRNLTPFARFAQSVGSELDSKENLRQAISLFSSLGTMSSDPRGQQTMTSLITALGDMNTRLIAQRKIKQGAGLEALLKTISGDKALKTEILGALSTDLEAMMMENPEFRAAVESGDLKLKDKIMSRARSQPGIISLIEGMAQGDVASGSATGMYRSTMEQLPTGEEEALVDYRRFLAERDSDPAYAVTQMDRTLNTAVKNMELASPHLALQELSQQVFEKLAPLAGSSKFRKDIERFLEQVESANEQNALELFERMEQNLLHLERFVGSDEGFVEHETAALARGDARLTKQRRGAFTTSEKAKSDTLLLAAEKAAQTRRLYSEGQSQRAGVSRKDAMREVDQSDDPQLHALREEFLRAAALPHFDEEEKREFFESEKSRPTPYLIRQYGTNLSRRDRATDDFDRNLFDATKALEGYYGGKVAAAPAGAGDPSVEMTRVGESWAGRALDWALGQKSTQNVRQFAVGDDVPLDDQQRVSQLNEMLRRRAYAETDVENIRTRAASEGPSMQRAMAKDIERRMQAIETLQESISQLIEEIRTPKVQEVIVRNTVQTETRDKRISTQAAPPSAAALSKGK